MSFHLLRPIQRRNINAGGAECVNVNNTSMFISESVSSASAAPAQDCVDHTHSCGAVPSRTWTTVAIPTQCSLVRSRQPLSKKTLCRKSQRKSRRDTLRRHYRNALHPPPARSALVLPPAAPPSSWA